MNLSTKLIKENYQLPVAVLNMDGNTGLVKISQTPAQCRTDVASVIVSVKGSKAIKLKMNTRVEMEGLREYLAEFYINREYVVSWHID